jgi:thiamine transport system permease protein
VLGAFILPPAVIATGWFIVLSRYASVTGLAPLLVVVMNALMALPFVHAALAPAVAQAAGSNDRLCASLGVSGLNRFRLIDLPVLRRAIGLSLVMGFIVSLGDLTAILLFGAEGFVTLPALIYQQMGSYRMEGSAFTALVLTVLSFLLILLADRWSRADD